MSPSSVDATTSRECAACRLLHEPGQGWDFCERDLDVTGLFSEENDRGRVDRLISMPSREDREMNFFRLYVDKEHRWSRGDDAWVEEARQEPPIASVAYAATLGLPTVLATLLGARANPNATQQPYRSRLNQVRFAQNSALHCVVEVPEIPAPVEARAACVKELLQHKADAQSRNVCGATPLDLLVRREIRMLQTGGSHRQLAEAMGPDMVLAFDAELEALRRRRVYVIDGCLCLSELHPEDPGWPDIACNGPCAFGCYQKKRIPPLRCDVCQIWTAGPIANPTAIQEAKSRRLQSVCPTCRVAQQGQRKCAKCETLVANAQHGLKQGEHAYCSERCKHPRCNGQAANGRPCAEERTRSMKYNRNRPRYDQEPQWFCLRCRKKEAA